MSAYSGDVDLRRVSKILRTIFLKRKDDHREGSVSQASAATRKIPQAWRYTPHFVSLGAWLVRARSVGGMYSGQERTQDREDTFSTMSRPQTTQTSSSMPVIELEKLHRNKHTATKRFTQILSRRGTNRWHKQTRSTSPPGWKAFHRPKKAPGSQNARRRHHPLRTQTHCNTQAPKPPSNSTSYTSFTSHIGFMEHQSPWCQNHWYAMYQHMRNEKTKTPHLAKPHNHITGSPLTSQPT